MGDFIKVDLDGLKRSRLKLIELYDLIKENEKRINDVNDNLSFLLDNYSETAKNITKIATNIGENVEDCTNAIICYATLKKMNIADNINIFSSFKHMYGSDQASAMDILFISMIFSNLSNDNQQKYDEIVLLFEKVGITDQNEISYLLNRAKMCGCGFASLTNNIFCAYEKIYGDDANSEFEKVHGYPMYYEEDGKRKYNFEIFFTEIFLKKSIDRYNNSNFSFLSLLTGGDYSVLVDQYYEFLCEELPSGVECEMQEYRSDDINVKNYLKEKEINDYDYGVIAVFGFTLKPYGNNPNDDTKFCEGGHWMSITGISSNGNFIVSSWGYEWELTSWDSSEHAIIREDEFNNKAIHDNSPRLIMIKVGDSNEDYN